MHTHTSIYTYILFTACGPLKHQRVMSGRRNQVFRKAFPASLVTPGTSYENVKIGNSQVQ